MVALDTNIYIYFLEKNPQFFNSSEQAIRYALQEGTIIVPTIAIMEIMSGASVHAVLDFFARKQFEVCDFTYDLAVLAGKLRYDNEVLKSADAIHIATALANGARQFITNDERLSKLKLELEVISLKQVGSYLSGS